MAGYVALTVLCGIVLLVYICMAAPEPEDSQVEAKDDHQLGDRWPGWTDGAYKRD